MRVYVLGLGHIGLPIAAWVALCGYQVTGIDTNANVVGNIENGQVPLYEFYNGRHISQIIRDLIDREQFEASTDLTRTDRSPSVFIIAVGLDDDDNGNYDLSPLQEALDMIFPHLVAGDLLLFKTTMIPGTCEDFIMPQVNRLGFTVHLAYCPETISEANAFRELQNNPRILAATDQEGFEKAYRFLASLSDTPVYQASDFKTAEMVKVVQNISRDVNIALVNELSDAARELDIDILEIQRLASTHPRVELLQPGPGVGGYCLPKALGYLKAAFAGRTIELPLMETARKVNRQRPATIVKLVENALQQADKSIKGAKIALLGLAMKDYCADCRYSPALDIVNLLREKGALVRAFDPLVPLMYEFQVASFEQSIAGADCLVIVVNQPDIDLQPDKIAAYMSNPAVVVDTRRIFPPSDLVKLYKL